MCRKVRVRESAPAITTGALRCVSLRQVDQFAALIDDRSSVDVLLRSRSRSKLPADVTMVPATTAAVSAISSRRTMRATTSWSRRRPTPTTRRRPRRLRHPRSGLVKRRTEETSDSVLPPELRRVRVRGQGRLGRTTARPLELRRRLDVAQDPLPPPIRHHAAVANAPDTPRCSGNGFAFQL
jgi:hypothetical protein